MGAGTRAPRPSSAACQMHAQGAVRSRAASTVAGSVILDAGTTGPGLTHGVTALATILLGFLLHNFSFSGFKRGKREAGALWTPGSTPHGILLPAAPGLREPGTPRAPGAGAERGPVAGGRTPGWAGPGQGHRVGAGCQRGPRVPGEPPEDQPGRGRAPGDSCGHVLCPGPRHPAAAETQVSSAARSPSPRGALLPESPGPGFAGAEASGAPHV